MKRKAVCTDPPNSIGRNSTIAGLDGKPQSATTLENKGNPPQEVKRLVITDTNKITEGVIFTEQKKYTDSRF